MYTCCEGDVDFVHAQALAGPTMYCTLTLHVCGFSGHPLRPVGLLTAQTTGQITLACLTQTTV